MLANFISLALAFQLWVITSTCVRAQSNQLSNMPPYRLELIDNSGMENNIRFTCVAANNFPVEDWVLYRNGVRENTTDPCTSPGKDAGNFLTISSQCDGHYSCGAEYMNNTELVLSEPLTVYGTYTYVFGVFCYLVFLSRRRRNYSDWFVFMSPLHCLVCKLLSFTYTSSYIAILNGLLLLNALLLSFRCLFCVL